MATPVIMPRQGQSVESCIISKWTKQKGEKIAAGEILFSYETDKAAFDFESPVDGTVLEIFFEEGDDVPVLTNVCVVGDPGEDAEQFRPAGDGATSAPAASEKPAEADAAAAPAAQTTVAAAELAPQSLDEIKISPRARNLAGRSGVDPRLAQGSGPYGRIMEKDIAALAASGLAATKAAQAGVAQAAPGSITGTGIGGRITTADLERALTAQPATAQPQPAAQAQTAAETTAEYEDVKISNIRKVIAKSMQASLSNTAQLTLNSSFDATDLLAIREKFKEARERLGIENITLNDMIVYAVSRTIKAHKDLNAHFLDDKMRYFKNVHIGIAVDTDRGLMVPTVFDADQKSLGEISTEIKSLASQCQKGTISPDSLKGASFTLTNLGTFGVESFTPVINPPQTGILGINTIVRRPREGKDGVEFYPAMGLSLTFDHKAIDGAPAARFLMDLKNMLENFTVLLSR